MMFLHSGYSKKIAFMAVLLINNALFASDSVATELTLAQEQALAQLGDCLKRAVWQEELGDDPLLKDYANILSNFQATDLEKAGVIVSLLQENDIWSKFLKNKDEESLDNLTKLTVYALQKIVWQDCELMFPPKLSDIVIDMKKSGLQEEEYCAKLRLSLLVFLVMVSSIDVVINSAN